MRTHIRLDDGWCKASETLLRRHTTPGDRVVAGDIASQIDQLRHTHADAAHLHHQPIGIGAQGFSQCQGIRQNRLAAPLGARWDRPPS